MKSKITILALALLVFSFGLSFGQSVSLEHVTGLNVDDEIIPGEEVIFYIRITNRDIQQDVISNGFEISSPDGAVWTPMDETVNPATLNPAYAWDLNFGFPCMFDLGFFVNYFSTGADADTVGFGGAVGMYGTGLAPLWNDTAYWFSIGVISEDCEGMTIVLDSCFYPPAGRWVWDKEGEAVAWDGPHTFTVESDGVSSVAGAALPTKFDMKQNYPNPFNPTTEILFDVPTRSHVQINVYNVLGQMVTTLVNEDREAGTYIVSWDGTSSSGGKVSSGVYFYKMEAGDFVQTKKMALLK